MYHDLDIHLHEHARGDAIQRVLGVIERRGFGLIALLAPPPEFGRPRALRVCVDAAARDPATLARQLDKLFDVRRAELVVRSRSRVVST